jgi:hypothetical protein
VGWEEFTLLLLFSSLVLVFVFSDMYFFLARQCFTAFRAVITLSSPNYEPMSFDDSTLAGIPCSNMVVQPFSPSIRCPNDEIPSFPTNLCYQVGILAALAASFRTWAKPSPTNSIFVSCNVDLNFLLI